MVTTSKTYSDGTTDYTSRTTGIDCVSFDETGTIKTTANTFDDCPECVPPADGTIGILPPKGSTTEMPDDGDCNTSKEDLKKVFPNTDDVILDKITNFINEHAQDFGIDSKEELQHFLSQAGHESTNVITGKEFGTFEENLNFRVKNLGIEDWNKYFNPFDKPDADPNKANPLEYAKSWIFRFDLCH